MANEQSPILVSNPDTKTVLAELEVPFPSDQVQWRVTNTYLLTKACFAPLAFPSCPWVKPFFLAKPSNQSFFSQQLNH